MVHPQIRFQNVLRITALALLTFAAVAVWAQKIVKPIDGATVRETVRVAVDASAVPSGGYISVYIDGHFVGATAGETDAKASGKPVIVFAWDSKLPFQDTTTGTPEAAKDGKHSLRVDMHDSGGDVKDTEASTFNLANKAPRLSPNDKVRIIYRYSSGVETAYAVRIEGRMGEYTGDDSGTVPLLASYTMRQTIEDARRDGSALISYRVGAGGSCQVLGNIVALNGGKAGSSVYKEMDKYGEVIRQNGVLQDNVLAKKGRRSLPDLLVELPHAAVKIGESWQSEEKEEFSVEGIGDVVKLSSTNTLDDLEWEQNLVCAKITSVFTGMGRLVGGDSNPSPTKIDGQGVYYVSLKTGKMLKSTVTLTSSVSLEVPTSSGAPADSGPSGGSAYSPSGDDLGDDYGGAAPMRSPAPSSNPSGTTGAAIASGTLKVTIETEL